MLVTCGFVEFPDMHLGFVERWSRQVIAGMGLC